MPRDECRWRVAIAEYRVPWIECRGSSGEWRVPSDVVPLCKNVALKYMIRRNAPDHVGLTNIADCYYKKWIRRRVERNVYLHRQ